MLFSDRLSWQAALNFNNITTKRLNKTKKLKIKKKFHLNNNVSAFPEVVKEIMSWFSFMKFGS